MKRSFEIVADGRKTDGEATGVGQYQRALFSELARRCEVRVLRGRGAGFHLKAAIAALRRRAVYFSPESLIVPAILGKRSMLTVHDLTPLTHPERHTRRNLIFHKALLSVALRRTGAIIVPTSAVEADVIERFPPSVSQKVRVIHEGVRFNSVGAPTVPMTERKRAILYLGTIEPRKNVSTLCRAFADSLAKSQGWQLVLIGKRGWLSDEQVVELDSAVRASGADELGYRDNDEVAAWLRSAALFVYPSEAEGFGLPPLEAMASGLPVVVSDDPALVEVVGDAAVIVRRGDLLQQELTESIDRLTSNQSELSRLQQAGIERAQYFDWGRAAAETYKLASELFER